MLYGMNTNAPDLPAPTSTSPIEKPRAFVGLRLLALVYDVFPVVALWMLAAAGFTFLYFVTGHVVRENIQPFSSWQWFLWITCFFLTGGYAVLSWHLGGQTLGMRPWRLLVERLDGGLPKPRWLWVRFLVGLVSLLAVGMGFWWAWIDKDRLTWHDRASGTRIRRMPKGWDPDERPLHRARD
jgi:uncharacterized RDD family membrane protein YckC